MKYLVSLFVVPETKYLNSIPSVIKRCRCILSYYLSFCFDCKSNIEMSDLIRKSGFIGADFCFQQNNSRS